MGKNRQKPSLNIVIPVYNEEEDLAKGVVTLHDYLRRHLTDFVWEITIVDNASTDRTADIAKNLAKTYAHIRAERLSQKGRGRAVKYAWGKSMTDFVAYMDVDLSTDLKHFPSLVRHLQHGYDVAIGSRNAKSARVYGRNILRTITSKAYIFLIKCIFFVHFTDAQCGFKAMTRGTVLKLLPHVLDDEWFFDTEILILAEKVGLTIFEEPVTWVDNPGSTVRVWKTALGDLMGLFRLVITRPWKTI
ncbi:glycosyltransferase [Candidatus Gottesmanbacteria bacterium]|nr:glycosyltransferase [Candidatus Gottesmanbacteria bacterium]